MTLLGASCHAHNLRCVYDHLVASVLFMSVF